MRAFIDKIKWKLMPKSERRYTVRLLDNQTGGWAASRLGAEAHGGSWSAKHSCYLFTQEFAEWHCYVRNYDKSLPESVQAYVERVI